MQSLCCVHVLLLDLLVCWCLLLHGKCLPQYLQVAASNNSSQPEPLGTPPASDHPVEMLLQVGKSVRTFFLHVLVCGCAWHARLTGLNGLVGGSAANMACAEAATHPTCGYDNSQMI